MKDAKKVSELLTSLKTQMTTECEIKLVEDLEFQLMEEWRDIKGYEGLYQVSNFDKIKTQVNHIDGNKSNNRVENLEWVTPQENMHHAFDKGLIKIGSTHHSSKLTEEQARFYKNKFPRSTSSLTRQLLRSWKLHTSRTLKPARSDFSGEEIFMAVTKFAHEYHLKMFPGDEAEYFNRIEPEYVEIFENFAYDEVVNQSELDGHTRFLAILAMLIGCQGLTEYKANLPAALNFGVTPVEAKEIVYQATAYLGIGKMFPFLLATNERPASYRSQRRHRD